MSDLPALSELEAGIEYYIDIAKKYKLKALLGTLLPIYGWRTYAPFREQMKNGFNDWIRSYANGKADGVIDFDKLLRSEYLTCEFAEGYDSGDHLHPSEKAYAAMAELAFGEIQK